METTNPARVFGWQSKVFDRGQGEGLAANLDTNASSPNRIAVYWRESFLEGSQKKQSLLSLNSLSPTFVCDSRFAALTHLAPRLTALDNGTLRGQNNAFILAGTRGVGKTWFVKSLYYVVAKMAKSSTFTVYCNYKSTGVVEPVKLLLEALQKQYPDIDIPEWSESIEFHEVLDVMNNANLRCFLIIDEVEEIYKLPANNVVADRVYRQLYTMGEMACKRLILPLLIGSAAALRPLLYSKGGHKLKEQYPCYLRFSSLNDRKYPDLVIRPVVTEADTVRAVLAISSDGTCRQTLIETGRLIEAGHRVGTRDCIVDGLTVSSDYLTIVSSTCCGLANHMTDAIVNNALNSRSGLFQNLSREEKGRLKRLMDAWIESLGDSSPAVTAAKIFDRAIVRFGMDLKMDDESSVWFQMMDDGLLYFDDRSRRVQFLHPSDAGALLVALYGSHEENELSLAEEVSMLAPKLASADEINETLVLESPSVSLLVGQSNTHPPVCSET
jgi:hypothetical protein